MQNAMNINLKKEVKNSFKKVLDRYTVNSEDQSELDSDLFDVALEGISYVWLKYPELISEKLKELNAKSAVNNVPLLKLLLNSMLAQETDEEF